MKAIPSGFEHPEDFDWMMGTLTAGQTGIIAIEANYWGDFEQLDTAAWMAIATVCANYNDQGRPLIVRFLHEFNGAWYSWGNKPDMFKVPYIYIYI